MIENFKSIITKLAHHGVFFMDQVNLMVIKNTTGDITPVSINPIEVIYGTPYIIDWSHVTQGNASADVART